MSAINAHTLVVLLLITTTFLAHYAHAIEPAMTTDTFLDNISDKNNADSLLVQKRASFFVGSRYGRSSNSPKARRPRNDRFFLGSRYGKRSGEYPSPIIFDGDTNTDFNEMNKNNKNLMMSCVYTGVKNLYRCNNMEQIKKIISQFTDTQRDVVEQAQQQQ